MGWFCLIITGVGLAIGIGAFFFSRFYALERRLQTQENRIKTLEDNLRDLRVQPVVEMSSECVEGLPPVLEPLPEIPKEARAETMEPPRGQPTIPEVAATSQVMESALPKDLPTLPKLNPLSEPEEIEMPALDNPPIVEPELESLEETYKHDHYIGVKGNGGWEMKLGTVWLVRVGVLAFLVFLVLLGQHGYKQVDVNIRPYLNASMLYLASFVLMAVGLFLHRRFRKLEDYSEVLTGGGMAAVYFSTFALYRVKNKEILGLIDNPLLAGILLGAWAIFIIIFATRKRSEIMAMFALAGAYFASYMPLIYDSSGDNIWFTFASNIMLAVAATFFVIKNRWANLSFLALVSSYFGLGYWRFVHPAGIESSFEQDALFIGVYWIIFTTAGFLSRHEQIIPAKRATFINLNNGAFFALMTITLLMQASLREQYWMLPMIFAPVLFGLFVLAKKTLPEEKLFAETLLVKASVVLTLSLMTLNPVEQHRALLLAAECITILYFGLRTGNRLLQYASATIALVGTAFVGFAIVKTVGKLHGGFYPDTLVLGLFFGLLILAGGWVAKNWEGERKPTDSLRILPDYLAIIGLGAGLFTCFAVTAKDYTATTAFGLAAFGLLALASRPLMRVTAVTIFGEIYIFSGLILWLPLGFSQDPITIETWNPFVMLAIFALAQQWHQRFASTEEEPAPFISTICQGACVIGLGLIATAWTLQLLTFETTHMSVAAVILGLMFAAYSYGLRSDQIFTLGQFFLIGAPVLCVIQTIPNTPTITWQWSLLPLLAALGDGFVLERAKESLTGRLVMPVVSFGILGGAAQVAGLMAGLMVTLEFVPLAYQLWVLPLIGIVLSTFCLGARLLPGLISAQGFMLTAATLSLLSIIKISERGTVLFFTSSVPDANGLSTLLPALGLLGMSHFALHTRDLINETERALRQLTNGGTSLYFYLGWGLSMVWAFQFINGQFIFLIFNVIAILHAALYHRRERIERAITGGGFLLVGFISFWMHAMMHWGDPRPLDIAPLALLLGAQWLTRKKIPEEKFFNSSHIAIIILMNLSLWQWVIRMWPGDSSVISWGTLAFVLIGLGLWAKERTHRIFGLIVLLAAMANLTLLASRKLDGMAELLTYLGMSVILILLGLLYIKFQEKLKEYL